MSRDPSKPVFDAGPPTGGPHRRRQRLGFRRPRRTPLERAQARLRALLTHVGERLARIGSGRPLEWPAWHDTRTRTRAIAAAGALGALLLVGAIGLLIVGGESKRPEHKLAPLPSIADTRPMTVQYRRPARAPNGQPWPVLSGYLEGLPQLRMDGRSSVLVDNSRNRSDILVKLVAIAEDGATTIRTAYVRRLQSFKITATPPGRYELRFQDVDTGAAWRSHPFALSESGGGETGRYTEARFLLLFDGPPSTIANESVQPTPVTAMASHEF